MRQSIQRLEKLSPTIKFFILMIGASFTLLAPVWATGKAMFWGTPGLQFIPWWNFAANVLKTGHLPLWNPWLGMGAPLMANYQSGLFYPFNWLLLILAACGGVSLLAYGLTFVIALHLSLAGLGMAKLVRRLGFSQLAQAVCGLAYGFCGYLIGRSGFPPMIFALTWLPWILADTGPGIIQIRWLSRQVLRLTFFIAMLLLAGHAQSAWYSLLLAGLWAGFHAAIDPSITHRSETEPLSGVISWKHARIMIAGVLKAEGKLLAAAAYGSCLAAVQLLPTAEYLLQSQRASAVGYEAAMTYSYWPWRLITLLAPDWFGNPAQGNYWGYGYYWEDAAYVGVLPLLLAVRGFFSGKSNNPNIRRWFLAFIAAASLILALGQNTSIFPWLYRQVPTFDMFQAPARWMIWVDIALILLAALGIDDWRQPEGRALYWTRLGTAGAFAVTLGAGIAWMASAGIGATAYQVNPTFIRAAALAGLWMMVVGFLSLTAPEARPELQGAFKPDKRINLWQSAVVLSVLFDLMITGWGLAPGVDLSFYRKSSPLVDDIQASTRGNRIFLPETDERFIKFDRFFRNDTFFPNEPWDDLRALLLPNMTMLDSIPSANNFDPLVPKRYQRWLDELKRMPPQTQKKALQWMGVGAIEHSDLSSPYGVGLETLPNSRIYHFYTCALSTAGEDESLAAVLSARVNLDRIAVLETGDALESSHCSLDETQGGAAQRLDRMVQPNWQRYALQAEKPGWLVVADTWYPGWKAWVDGKETPVLRANYLFRAISIPVGNHDVQFRYCPYSFWVGLALSICACLGWLGIFAYQRKIGGEFA